ncbi:MAG: lysophospholipid acyltransferase family protein [Myxococcales bacterium]|nr:lysophospholipid acyltransferase family protein [Myxococcales bacterium]
MNRKRPWFTRAFRRVIDGHVRGGLDGVYIRGHEQVRAALQAGPVLLAPTHVSYWDALLALLFEEPLQAQGWALMERENLERLSFFGWLGALPIDLSEPGANRHALKAAASVLGGPGRFLVVFPQGRQRAPHLRPLGLRPGVHLLARISRAVVVPVGIAYAYREAPVAAAFVDMGPPVPVTRDRTAFLEALEQGIVGCLERIDAHLEHPEGEYDTLRAPKGGHEGWGTTLLSWMTRSVDRIGGPRV